MAEIRVQYNATPPTVADTQWTGLQVDAAGKVLTVSDHATRTLGHGVKTVTTAGTDVVLANSTPAKWVLLQAQTDNTGYIAIGTAGVDATVATGNGVLLNAGESITLPIDNLADIYIDSIVSGDGVRYLYGAG